MYVDRHGLIAPTICISIFSFVLLISCSWTGDDPSCNIVSRYKAVFTKHPERIPSNVSVDAPMMGNGFTGVAITGRPERQIFYLTRKDFWRLKSSYNESFPAVLVKIEIEMQGLPEPHNIWNRICIMQKL